MGCGGCCSVVRPVREIAVSRTGRTGSGYRGITVFDWVETGPVPTALTAATTNR